MELLEFWEEISLVPDAVRQIEKLEITEGEYEKLRELFLRDVNLFYEAVKKREDFRLVFLYCFSKMACEVYDRYCEQGISRRVYRDTFYDKKKGLSRSRCNRRRQFFGGKSEYFFHAALDIEFCVFPCLDFPQGVSGKSADNERTFWCP